MDQKESETITKVKRSGKVAAGSNEGWGEGKVGEY
jgi:hypothetical protein